MSRDVIIACDFENEEALTSFLNDFNHLENKPFLKIGMELFYKEGPELIRKLKNDGFKIFLDLKLHDIPNTVKKALKNVLTLDVEFVTIHSMGGVKMMSEAASIRDELNSKTKLLAVTILTSLDDEILNSELLINSNTEATVKHYCKNIRKANVDGIICSPNEASLAKEFGLFAVTPGIRLESDSIGDQKRVATPKLAKELGSEYIVVGRTITDSSDPVETYKKCMEDFS